MPTYEYICEKCGHEFELARAMSAKPLLVCPKEFCAQKKWGRGKVKKKISSGAGLIFKGSGFYITDYRSAKYQDAAKKDSAPKTSETKTETKPVPAPAKPAAKPEKK